MSATPATLTRKLTPHERSHKLALEAVVRRGFTAFIEVGNALSAIRDRRLYRDEFGSFDAYVRARWSIVASGAYKTIQASAIASKLPAHLPLPETAFQARRLAPLDTPEQRAEAWGIAVERAGGIQPRPRHVHDAVNAVALKARPRANHGATATAYDSRYLLGQADARRLPLPDRSVNCVVTSPPYFWLRDFGCPGQIGLEPTIETYVDALVLAFRDVRRVLRDDGTLWLNIGDSYNGRNGTRGDAPDFRGKAESQRPVWPDPSGLLVKTLKPKDRLGIPHRVVFALQADGWYWRDEVVWAKPNPRNESVIDRTTKSHELVFLLSKSERYAYDADAIREPATDSRFLTRNRRSVWSVSPAESEDDHTATFPEALVEPCVLAGSRPGDVVMDPFSGTGTAGLVALRLGRRYVGFDLHAGYLRTTVRRITGGDPRGIASD